MKYLKEFSTMSEFSAVSANTATVPRPNVSLINENDKVFYLKANNVIKYAATSKVSFNSNDFKEIMVSHTFENGIGVITFNAPLTVIGGYAFRNNYTTLLSVTIPNGVTSINIDAFSDCHALSSVTIPNSVTNIDQGAFYHCSGLTSITLPTSLTTIGLRAFNYCTALTSIVLPQNFAHFGSNAFEGCTSFTSVTSLAVVPPALEGTGGNWLANTNNCPIYVPSESVEAYKAPLTGWQVYEDRIQAIP